MDSRPQTLPGEIPAPPLPALDENLHVIHYSQERAEDCISATPTVSAIIVQHVLTDRQQTFAMLHLAEREGISPAELPDHLPELERAMLGDFFAFAAGVPSATWLHWRMRIPYFGFEVLTQRARRHGQDPEEFRPERTFDLANYLKRRFGCDYAPHPRLWHAIHRNGAASPGLLNEDQAAEAWSSGNQVALLRSLSRKVNAIATLYDRVRDGTFQCGGVDPASAEAFGHVEPWGGEFRQAGQGPEVDSSAPTWVDIAQALRRAGKKGKPMRAALVEHMADRRSSPVEEVADKVHGHRGTNCKRIAANVRRTNKELVPLGADFRFKLSAGFVHKVPAGSADDVSSRCRP